MGWAVGLVVSGLILRFGLGAESLAWFLVFAFAPVSCIYYPIDILPDWLQSVASILPSALVFEGMRNVLFDGIFRYDLFWKALGLNIIYILGGIGIFVYFFRSARERGLLYQIGE